MGNPNNRKCADCVYANIHTNKIGDQNMVTCLRNAQSVAVQWISYYMNSGYVSCALNQEDWCGEWRGADGATFLEDAETAEEFVTAKTANTTPVFRVVNGFDHPIQVNVLLGTIGEYDIHVRPNTAPL